MKNTNVKENTNSSRTAKSAYNEKVFREKAKHYPKKKNVILFDLHSLNCIFAADKIE